MIVPGGRASGALRRRLLQVAGVLSGDVVMTFVGLAEKVLAAEGSAVHAISAHARELLLRGILERLSTSGRISYFKNALDSAGFYRELGGLIRELKAWQIEPEKFAGLSGKKSARDAELGLIYTAYQEALVGSGLYDSEGRFWRARLVLQERCPFEEAPSELFLDGFTDFTPNEMSLLEVFSRYVEGITISLPYEKGRRGELFGKTEETLRRLRRDFTVKIVDVDELSALRSGAVCRRIAGCLFDDEAAGAKTPAEGCVQILATAGVRMEVTEIAREAKKLIAGGRRGEDIAVITRNVDGYRALVRDVFDEMRVPVNMGRVAGRERSGVWGLFSGIVSCVEGGFEREAVAGLLSSSYVDLAGLAGGEIGGGDVRRIAGKAGVVGGLGQWEKRLSALAERVGSDDAITVEQVELVQKAARRLGELLDVFNKGRSSAQAAAGAFSGLLEELGVRRRILESGLDEEVLFRDLAAFAALSEVLEALVSAGEDSTRLTLRQFVDFVERLLEGAGVSDGSIAGGGVEFLDVVSARNLSWPVVFFCGLTSEAFPAKLPVGPFYSRAERKELSLRGLSGRDEELHLAAERLLFYQAATRADERLYLTYPSTDEEGKAKLRSFYVEQLLELFELDDGERRQFGPSRGVVELPEAACAAEVAIAAGREIAEAGKVEEVERHSAAALGCLASFAASLRSGAVEAKRESLEELDQFDGMLTTEAALRVAEKFAAGRPWSASRLNDYRGCPFEFFLKRVLDCCQGEEIEPWLPALLEGSIEHAVLARFFAAVRDGGLLGEIYGEGGAEAPAGVFDEAFERTVRAHERRYGVSGDVFWEVEKSGLRRTLERFVDAELERLRKADKDGKFYVPRFFELSFGMEGAGGGDEIEDASSAGAPVVLEHEGQRERLRGKIDRVDFIVGDLAEAEGEECRGIAVVDYKRSAGASAPAVKAFFDLQMPVYLYAASRILKVEGGAVAMRAFYRTVKNAGGKKAVLGFSAEEGYAEFMEDFKRVVFEIVRGVRSGEFPAAPRALCSDYCIGRGICRYRQARMEHLKRNDGEDTA